MREIIKDQSRAYLNITLAPMRYARPHIAPVSCSIALIPAVSLSYQPSSVSMGEPFICRSAAAPPDTPADTAASCEHLRSSIGATSRVLARRESVEVEARLLQIR